jgi:hypothetical protein
VVTISNPIVLDRTRIYVIGDIQGRSDLLDRMVDHISHDLDARPISDCMTVTLGGRIRAECSTASCAIHSRRTSSR